MKIIYSKDNPKDCVKSNKDDRGSGSGDGKPRQVSNRLRSSNPTDQTLLEIEMTPVARVINTSKLYNKLKIRKKHKLGLQNTSKLLLSNCFVLPNIEIA